MKKEILISRVSNIQNLLRGSDADIDEIKFLVDNLLIDLCDEDEE